MNNNTAPANATELDARLATLAPYSRAVYNTIQASLYAEPGFSDVKAGDIARERGETLAAVRGALGHLLAATLIDMESEGWLHTYEHSKSLRGE